MQTAGNLCEQIMLDPSFFLVIAGRVLVVVHDPINDPGLVLAMLFSDHRLVVTPGTRIVMYTIEPTIMFAQLFLDYQCLDFIHKEEACYRCHVTRRTRRRRPPAGVHFGSVTRM